MRPLELRLRNFRSYFGDGAEFDFRERRLVGIVGPIGSGKSSILDAIAFALYNRTPDVGSATKSLIHQRADSAAVSFRFDVDGDVWEVQRLLRRKGQSQHALYRLKKDADGADKLEQVLQEGPVNDRIAELVGLDFEAFSRSMLLAQGRFAEFLTAPPRTRDKVLKGVFGYDRVDRMRETAKAMTRHSEIEAEKAAIKVQHLVDLTEQNEARREDHARAVERLEVLEKAAPELAELAEAERDADGRLIRSRGQLEQLDGVAEILPDRSETDALLKAQSAAATARTEAAAALDQARLVAEQAAAALDELEAGGERAALEEGQGQVAVRRERAAALEAAATQKERAQDRLERSRDSVAAQRVDIENAEERSAAAVEAFEAVAAAFRDVEADYHDAMHRDMAATLRSDLDVGAACPVCEQSVEVLPEGWDAPDVANVRDRRDTTRVRRDEAERSRSEATADLRSARVTLDAADERSKVARDALEQARSELDAAERGLVDVDERIETLLGPGDPAAVLEERKGALDAAENAAGAAARAYERSRQDHDEVIQGEQRAEARLAELRLQLATVGGRLGGPSVATEPVGAAAVEVLRRFEESRSGAREAAVEATAALATLEDRRFGILDGLDITGTFDDAIADTRARVKLIGEEIERTNRKLGGVDVVVAERDRLTARRDDFAKLASDFTDARFVRFLLDDERVRLAELGSEHFQRLSDGRYRFSDDGAFDVVDLAAADSVRKASSLSGGETFLASLALALALAEMVSRTGGRLDAFFLDEGFGTLDPEHLDLAMEGVESLVAEDASRLVVVVSHVVELRHRVEDLIELDRSPVTGDTKVVRA